MTQRFQPVKVMWIYALAVGAIMLLAMLWFVFHSIFWFTYPAAYEVAVTLGTNETEYAAVDNFFQVVDNYALIVALIALLIFVVVYSQRKGQQI